MSAGATSNFEENKFKKIIYSAEYCCLLKTLVSYELYHFEVPQGFKKKRISFYRKQISYNSLTAYAFVINHQEIVAVN
jgi:hypothetical protein